MGERKHTGPTLCFNRSVRLASHDEHLSSNAWLLLLHELDECWGRTSGLAARLRDVRSPRRTSWPLILQLRARLFAMAAGYSPQRDAAALLQAPVARLATSDRRGQKPLFDSAVIVQPTMARMHRVLGAEHDLRALSDAVFDRSSRVIREPAHARRGPHTIDVDSMPVMSHGQQPGSVWKGLGPRVNKSIESAAIRFPFPPRSRPRTSLRNRVIHSRALTTVAVASTRCWRCMARRELC